MNPRILSILLLAGCASPASTPSTTPTPSAGAAPAAPNAAWPDEGPATWAPRPTTAAITPNDLRTRLYKIADDSMAGRRIGEVGNLKTTAYIAKEFERLGLKPAGENGTYFQALPYGASRFDSSSAQLIAGGTPAPSAREWIPLPPTPYLNLVGNANVRNATAVYAGRWGDSTVTLDPALFRGKAAVFAMPAPRIVGRRSIFVLTPDPRVARLGASLVLIEALDSLPPSVIGGVFAERRGMRPEEGQGAAAAAIGSALATRLFGRPLAQVAVGTAGSPVDATWRYSWAAADYPARNVIGVLRGSDPALAGEYVLLGAHNDHVGTLDTPVDHDSVRAFNKVMRPQGANDAVRTPTPEQQRRIDSLLAHARSVRPPRMDSIMNGADDDGSGTVVMLEVAEYQAARHPRRSLIFISHQGEEAGLLGSQWFTEHPTLPLDSIVAALNMDMVGRGRVTDVRFGGPNSIQTLGSRRLSREYGDIIDSVNAVIEQPMAIDRSWDVPANPMNRFCRSDQVNYVLANIPVTYFSTGYTPDYHQATDEPRYIDYTHAARLGNFIAQIMTAIADRDTKPAIAGPDPAYPLCR